MPPMSGGAVNTLAVQTICSATAGETASNLPAVGYATDNDTLMPPASAAEWLCAVREATGDLNAYAAALAAHSGAGGRLAASNGWLDRALPIKGNRAKRARRALVQLGLLRRAQKGALGQPSIWELTSRSSSRISNEGEQQ